MRPERLGSTVLGAFLILVVATCIQVAAADNTAYSTSVGIWSGRGFYSETIEFNNAAYYGMGSGFNSAPAGSYIEDILVWGRSSGTTSFFSPTSSGGYLSSLMQGNSGYGTMTSVFSQTGSTPAGSNYLHEAYYQPGGNHGRMNINSFSSASGGSFSASISVGMLG